MILTVLFILLGLVALNFVLLVVSVNKTTKKVPKRSEQIRIAESSNLSPNESVRDRLAPTGS